MVVAVEADGGRLKAAYLDSDGELPNNEQMARIKGYIQAMSRQVSGRTLDIELNVRPWQRSDGTDLVDWRTALRRWGAKGGPRS